MECSRSDVVSYPCVFASFVLKRPIGMQITWALGWADQGCKCYCYSSKPSESYFKLKYRHKTSVIGSFGSGILASNNNTYSFFF